MAVVYLAGCWLVGVWLAATVTAPLSFWLGAVLGGALGLVGGRSRLRLGFACLVALAGGGVRYLAAQPAEGAAHITFYQDEQVRVTGMVASDPERRDRSQQFWLEPEAVEVDGEVAPAVSGQVLVRTPRFPLFEYGERLRVEGVLELPKPLGAGVEETYLVMSWPRIEQLPVQAASVSPLYRPLYALRQQARTTIAQLLPQPEAALLQGILLGDDSALPDGLRRDFRTTGMTHIIAISGFNVAILVAVLMRLVTPLLGRRYMAPVTLAGVALYTLLVGAEASVVRAALMAGVYLFSTRLLGRPTWPYASLFVVAFLMTLVSPFALWDIGFQLSFAATLGLMLYTEPLTEWTRQQLERFLPNEWVERVLRALLDSVLVTLAAQVLTVPLLLAYFQQLSLASLPANFLILPAQAGVMIWGGLATLVGLLSPLLATPLAWVAWLFLSYTVVMVRLLARLPLAVIPLGIGPGTLVILYFFILAGTWLLRQERQRRQQVLLQVRGHAYQGALAFSLALVALSWQWASTQPDGALHVAFLDVGQGDAVFIQTPNGSQVLVDGGYYPALLQEQLGRHLPAWDRHLDLIIATHPDADHVTGLPELFNRFRVALLLTNGAPAGTGAGYDTLLEAAAAAGTTIRQPQAGETVVIDSDVRLDFLHPGPEAAVTADNDSSISFRLVYGDFTLLLTGDGEVAAERAILESGQPVTAVAFKAGHHGARTSSNDFFLEQVRPQVIIVSAGKENRYGHPHPELLQRAETLGATVLRTDQMGTIELVTDGSQVWWNAYTLSRD